jgi:hypothetical protein
MRWNQRSLQIQLEKEFNYWIQEEKKNLLIPRQK